MSEKIENFDFNKFEISKIKQVLKGVKTKVHGFGKVDLAIGVLQKIGFDKLIKEAFSTNDTHQPDIPHETTGLLFLSNLIDKQNPLYNINQTFNGPSPYDFKGTFGEDINLEQLNDDRFGDFLDLFYQAGPSEIFSKVMFSAVTTYKVKPGNVNYDTTTKIMHGTFKTPEGSQTSSLTICRGYSKQKRHDKNQIQMGLGTMGGLVVGGKVLDGNSSDKTWNLENLEQHKDLMTMLQTEEKEEMMYIADSSLASKENFEEANRLGIKMITRMPDNFLLAKNMMEKWLGKWDEGEEITVETKRKDGSKFRIFEDTGVYEGMKFKVAVVYSYQLEKQKKETIEREMARELERVVKVAEKGKKLFACEADALDYVEELKKKNFKKLTYHTADINITSIKVRKAGRAPKDPNKQKYVTKYEVNINILEKDNCKSVKLQKLKKESTFVLVSNDFEKSAEEILTQYKTQSAVEVKFRQFKSRDFVNSLFVKKIERVEALMYLYLIALQVCSVIEYVVRRGLALEGDFIQGRGGTKQYSPTFETILEKFEIVGRTVISFLNEEERELIDNIDRDHLKILRYLGIELEHFRGKFT